MNRRTSSHLASSRHGDVEIKALAGKTFQSRRIEHGFD
jgi:hypothetical protein